MQDASGKGNVCAQSMLESAAKACLLRCGIGTQSRAARTAAGNMSWTWTFSALLGMNDSSFGSPMVDQMTKACSRIGLVVYDNCANRNRKLGKAAKALEALETIGQEGRGHPGEGALDLFLLCPARPVCARVTALERPSGNKARIGQRLARQTDCRRNSKRASLQTVLDRRSLEDLMRSPGEFAVHESTGSQTTRLQNPLSRLTENSL